MLNYTPNLDAVFKSLSDPSRRAMIMMLSRGETTLGQLAEPLSMTLPAVHQHLGVLEQAGIVICEKRGRERWCRLQSDALAHAEKWIGARRGLWQQRLAALDDFLAQTAPKNTVGSNRSKRHSSRRKDS